MRKYFVARNCTVGFSAREGETGRRGGERLEPQTMQIYRRAFVPRVWQNETSRLVECAKFLDGIALSKICILHIES
jgi:hypothetical protein